MENEKFNIILNRDQLFVLGEALKTFVKLNLAEFERVFNDLNDRDGMFLCSGDEDPERYNITYDLLSIVQRIIVGGDIKLPITDACVDYKAKMAFDMAKEIENKLDIIGYNHKPYFGTIINKASEEDPIVIITKE